MFRSQRIFLVVQLRLFVEVLAHLLFRLLLGILRFIFFPLLMHLYF